LAATLPSKLCRWPSRRTPTVSLLANYDIAPDGKRFLMMKGRQWLEGQLVVVLNWFSEWKQLGSGAKQ
jgi:hypothetical protein